MDRVGLAGKRPARYLAKLLVQLDDAIEFGARDVQSLAHPKQVMDVMPSSGQFDLSVTAGAVTGEAAGLRILQGAENPGRRHDQAGTIDGGQASHPSLGQHESPAIVGRGNQQLVGKAAHATASPATAGATRLTLLSICMSTRPLVWRRSPMTVRMIASTRRSQAPISTPC